MDNNSYLGGIWKRSSPNRATSLPGSTKTNEDWGWIGTRTELFVRGAAASCRLYTWDGLAILLRGYARYRGSSNSLDLDKIVEELRWHYLEQGELNVDDLDGSFTIALCDSQSERVLLYRNLIGTGFTYYLGGNDGLLFSSNLAELTRYAHGSVVANRGVLPSYFLFRCVPGRQTLFQDIFRLLPGEEISWDGEGVKRRQRHTFAHLYTNTSKPADYVDQVETTLASVLTDINNHRPGAANLLSGGVDSSYLQAIWNTFIHQREELPISYSISVDHPGTWQDTDYAITASQALGTQHRLVPADDAYEHYLIDAITSTGEPLNHVQSAYFGHLARVMTKAGIKTGICGEGADSLFGLGLANQVHNARVLGRLCPVSGLRTGLATLSNWLGWDRLAYTCQFANHLNDWAWLEHPVNRVAAFADWGAVELCFGQDSILHAVEERRQLLDLYEVPANPLDRMHAVGYLGEAMDSAGLWTTLFNRAGGDLACPFLDSRVLRLALNLPQEVRYRFRSPKDLLKRALRRRAPRELATRVKLGFGQPIFEWLAPNGQLHSRINNIGEYPFLEGLSLQQLSDKPTWFMYSLVVYDAWHKLFLEHSTTQVRATSNLTTPTYTHQSS